MNAIIFAIDKNAFWETAAGSTVKTLLATFGIFIVLGAIFKAASSFTQGKIGPGVKILFGAMVAAAFLFRPETLTDLVDFLGDLLDTLIGAGKDISQIEPSNQPQVD